MAWQVQHHGEFPDICGTVWRVEILRDTDGSVTPSELEFPADSPLVIEWPSLGFEEVMWGSSATLRVVSPGDRTYIDLYTIAPGAIRLDVYRDGAIFWSGMLDPEFYEEPYERLNGYEVELTFTDFGILDRLKYDLTGVVTVGDMLDRALELSGLNVTGYNHRACSLSAGPIYLRVDSGNFTDEEGEVMSWYEVLEGVLTPLGVRMGQRSGQVWLFDLDGLKEWYGDELHDIEWAGDSQTLGVDRVYNSVTVTFSPYARTDWVSDAILYDSAYSVTWYDLTNDNTGPDNGGATCFTYYPDYSQYGTGNADYTNLDFTIFLGEGSGVTLGGSATAGSPGFFHILPVYGSATECSGVYVTFFTGGHSSLAQGSPVRKGVLYPSSGSTGTLMTLPRVFVRGVPDNERKVTLIRLVQEVLLDCRYNPFNAASEYNEQDNQDTLEDSSAFVFMTAFVRLYDSETGGTCLWHYDNSTVAQGSGTDKMVFGEWVEGDSTSPAVWLEWYNPEDLTDNAGGAGGWKANRHCIGKPDGQGVRNSYDKVNGFLQNAPDGEFIPWPPEGGWLEVSLSYGLYGYQHGGLATPGDGDRWTDRGLYDVLRWWLVKSPELSVVTNDLTLSDAALDDVEYRGTLNESAQDDLSIDTVCGTADGAPLSARGLFLNADGSQVTEMTRGGYTARLEKLLIAQLYRQYAGRKTVLTGEAEPPEALLLSEQNQGDALFVLCAETLDARAATSEIEVRELGEDRYTSE